jgi:hypothetical protein
VDCTSIYGLRSGEVFRDDQQSNTAPPNVAAIAAILNMVPITTNLNDERDCDGDAGFLPFCFFVAIADAELFA